MLCQTRLRFTASWPHLLATHSRSLSPSSQQYLFFQGPTSKTGYQDDLPNFFSKENFADFQITPLQIAVTVTGIGSFAVVASALL
mmetsp:Transcript_16997/g.47415  ORF Transcript_16997/g.47415 Transcript_16997/m.47415 type:complete len:85 (+) Transcript_16997:285-539(+)